MSDVFKAGPSHSASTSDHDKKWLLARQLSLMCCTDLSPFETVEKPGFVKFLMQNRVIKHADDLPSAVTLSHAALNTVYDQAREKIKHLIQKAPKTVGMTTDLWTDNCRRRSYAAFTLLSVVMIFACTMSLWEQWFSQRLTLGKTSRLRCVKR